MNAALRRGPVVLLLLAACNGRVEGPSSTGDGAPGASTPTAPADGTAAATPTATPTATKVSLDGVRELELSRGVLGGPRVANAACQAYERSVRLVRATRTVTWTSCSNATGTNVPATGTRILTTEEEALFEAHVLAATYQEADGKNCGYDGTIFAMNVIADGGTQQLYVDDNVNCYTDGRRVAPDVRDLVSELWQTASGTPLLP